ncbi:MAG: NACHT domain-containing protein [Symploca sp. SIO2E6]|nr:NACHT domain-containing protein [Symploca sp. SIO2E6]
MSKASKFGKSFLYLSVINIVALLISKLANADSVKNLDDRLALAVTVGLIGVSAVIESSSSTASGKQPASWRWLKGLLQIAIAGFPLGLGIHFFLKGRWLQTFGFLVLTLIALVLPLLIQFINKLRQKSQESIDPLVDQGMDAIATRIISKVKFLLWELSSFEQKYYESLVYNCRDYQTQGLDKDRTLKLQRVFVPLKIVSKEVVQVDPKMIQRVEGKAGNPKEKQIWDFLAAMKQYPALRHLAVLGAPGSGKTTLLRYLTLIYATKQQRRRHPQAPKLIPVLLSLRDVRQVIAEKQPPLAELITQQVQQQRQLQPLNPPPDWFAEKLTQKQCLVMLDGLDEVADPTQRQQVSRWVDRQMQAYPDTPFILTSRPFGYQSAQLQQGVTVLEVQPFNLQQVQRFIHSWYWQTEVMSRAGEDDLGVREEAKKQGDDLLKRIRKSSPLAAMAVNPLLLTMIATVHRRGSALPGKRVELYKEICQVLLEKRQRAKEMETRGHGDTETRRMDRSLSASQKQSVLQLLAIDLMQHNTRGFNLPEGITLIEQQLAGVAGSGTNPQEFFQQIKDVSGLLVEKELGVYEFAHLSFQEYLAAVEIKETNQEQLLIDNIDNPWWNETIRLYAAQTNASNLIRAVLVSSSPSVEVMALAYDCLEEGLIVDSEVRQQLEARLEVDLGDLGTDKFRLAANVLLSRRLNNLVRIEENVEIDLSYITCAEYQLFIDEMRQAGENRQPDHWQDYRFPPGDARKPITGVRGSDAEEFCEWLTQQHSALGFRYRLPTLAEVKEYSATEQQIGCWCNDGEIAGIEASWWQDWYSKLAEVTILNRNFDLNLDLNRDFNQNLYQDLERVLNQNLYQDLNLNLNRVLYKDLYRDLDRFLNQVLYRNLDRFLNRFLYRDFYQVLYRVLNQDLYRDLDRVLEKILYRVIYQNIHRNLYQVLDRDLNRKLKRYLYQVLYKKIEANEASDFLILYFPLLFFIVIYQLLSIVYQATSQDRKALEQINLSRQECEEISRKYQYKIDEIYPIYVHLVLQDERQAGRIPAWEGIRLVRELRIEN